MYEICTNAVLLILLLSLQLLPYEAIYFIIIKFSRFKDGDVGYLRKLDFYDFSIFAHAKKCGLTSDRGEVWP